MKKTTAQKGLWAEQTAKAHFSLQKNCIVFEALGGVGMCDFMVWNTEYNTIDKYDVKYGGTRFLYNGGSLKQNTSGKGGMRLIHRVPKDKQKKLGIKIIYVMQDGTIKIPEPKEKKG